MNDHRAFPLLYATLILFILHRNTCQYRPVNPVDTSAAVAYLVLFDITRTALEYTETGGFL